MKRQRLHSTTWLFLLAGTLLLGIAMSADRSRASLFGIEGSHCLVGRLAGHNVCPGCGLTRSTSLVLHGRWRDALHLHPAGFAVVLLCAAGFILHAHILIGNRRLPVHDTLLSWGRRTFVAALLAAWAYRLIFFMPGR